MTGDHEWPHAGNYLEVSPGRRLRFTWYSASTNNQRSDVEIRFAARDGGTLVTIVHEGLPESESQGHHDGWSELLSQLADVQSPAKSEK